MKGGRRRTKFGEFVESIWNFTFWKEFLNRQVENAISLGVPASNKNRWKGWHNNGCTRKGISVLSLTTQKRIYFQLTCPRRTYVCLRWECVNIHKSTGFTKYGLRYASVPTCPRGTFWFRLLGSNVAYYINQSIKVKYNESLTSSSFPPSAQIKRAFMWASWF